MEAKGIEVKEGRDGSVGKKKGWIKEGLGKERIGKDGSEKGWIG